MSHDELERLIQDHLDGRATEEDARRLRERLNADPEARERFRQAEIVFGALHSLSLEDPPPGLTGVLSAAVVHPRHAGVGERLGTRWGLAFTFAVGVAAGGLGLWAMDRSSLGGSPADLPLGGTVPVAGRDLDRKRIPLGQGEVLLHSRRAGDQVVIRVETRATAGPRIRLDFDPVGLTLISFQSDPDSPTAESVVFDDRHLELQAAPEGRYTLHFRGARSPAPLVVTLEGPTGVVRERVEVGPLRSP